MKATEFRLGNLVEQRLIGGDKRKFVGVDVDVLKNIYQGNVYFNYLPIPLTEEILLKCGFDHDVDYMMSKKGLTICFEKIGDALMCFLECANIEIKYLHQLQNLYFALTGEELEVNL